MAAAAEPWYLVSNLEPSLDLVWAYGKRFCCEQLFRDQKSGIFQLERSGLRDPARIDRLLLVVAIAVLISHLQGYAVSLAGERRRVDPRWKRGLSFARIRLHRMRSVRQSGLDHAWGISRPPPIAKCALLSRLTSPYRSDRLQPAWMPF